MKKINNIISIANPRLGKEEAHALSNVIMSGFVNEGAIVHEFEKTFTRYIGTKDAVAFFNGTVALHSLFVAYGIGSGDEVIVPSLTFVSTATSVLHAGAKPVFADIDERTFTIDVGDVLKKISSRTKAIVAVHYAGQSADMSNLLKIAKKKNIIVIEDAAEAHGAVHMNKKVGGWGDAAMFSFTPTKSITTGEGGMVTTNDSKLVKKLRLLKNHGQDRQYHHALVGYNYRMTEMQGALGIEQLKKLESIIEKKRKIARTFDHYLSNVEGITIPYEAPTNKHTYMMYTIRVNKRQYGMSRDELIKKMEHLGIQTKIYFPPVHRQPIFKNYSTAQSLIITDKISKEILSLPIHSKLTEQEVFKIISGIQKRG
jgi:perosamine synthetase